MVTSVMGPVHMFQIERFTLSAACWTLAVIKSLNSQCVDILDLELASHIKSDYTK